MSKAVRTVRTSPHPRSPVRACAARRLRARPGTRSVAASLSRRQPLCTPPTDRRARVAARVQTSSGLETSTATARGGRSSRRALSGTRKAARSSFVITRSGTAAPTPRTVTQCALVVPPLAMRTAPTYKTQKIDARTLLKRGEARLKRGGSPREQRSRVTQVLPGRCRGTGRASPVPGDPGPARSPGTGRPCPPARRSGSGPGSGSPSRRRPPRTW